MKQGLLTAIVTAKAGATLHNCRVDKPLRHPPTQHATARVLGHGALIARKSTSGVCFDGWRKGLSTLRKHFGVRPGQLAALFAMAVMVHMPAAHSEEIIKRNFLVKSCTAKSPADINACAGYIAGIADLAANPPPPAKPEVCFTGPVALKILRESVTLYLQGHPGPDGPAAPPVYEALKTLYKC